MIEDIDLEGGVDPLKLTGRIWTAVLSGLLTAACAGARGQMPATGNMLLGEAEQGTSSEEQGVEELSRSLESAPRDPQIRLRLGIAHLQKGELTLAEEQFREALKIDPSRIEAHLNLGWTHFKKAREGGDPDDVVQERERSAEEEFLSVLSLVPASDGNSRISALLGLEALYQRREERFRKKGEAAQAALNQKKARDTQTEIRRLCPDCAKALDAQERNNILTPPTIGPQGGISLDEHGSKLLKKRIRRLKDE